jgi:hypothetical protein
MEYIEFGDNRRRIEKIQEVTQELAIDLAWGNITTDNPSPSTSLDALDQIILFELGEYIDETITLCYLRNKTLLESEDILDEEQDVEINKGKNPCIVTSVNIDDEIVKSEINCIAIYNVAQTYWYRITIDNPSPSNGKTSLEQLVDFHFRDYISSENDSQVLTLAVKNRIKELETGSDLSSYCLDDNFITVTF